MTQQAMEQIPDHLVQSEQAFAARREAVNAHTGAALGAASNHAGHVRMSNLSSWARRREHDLNDAGPHFDNPR